MAVRDQIGIKALLTPVVDEEAMRRASEDIESELAEVDALRPEVDESRLSGLKLGELDASDATQSLKGGLVDSIQEGLVDAVDNNMFPEALAEAIGKAMGSDFTVQAMAEATGTVVGEGIAGQQMQLSAFGAGIPATEGEGAAGAAATGSAAEAGMLAGGMGLTKIALGGVVALGILGAVGKTARLLTAASPSLQQTGSILGEAMRIFFRPFGNFLSTLLRPLAVRLLIFAREFTQFANDNTITGAAVPTLGGEGSGEGGALTETERRFSRAGGLFGASVGLGAGAAKGASIGGSLGLVGGPVGAGVGALVGGAAGGLLGLALGLRGGSELGTAVEQTDIDWTEIIEGVELESFVTPVTLPDFVTAVTLPDFVTAVDLSAFVTSVDLTGFVTSVDLNTFVDSVDWDRYLNGLVPAIRSSLSGFNPFGGGGSSGSSDYIPGFLERYFAAEGGVVTGPTRTFLGEAGPEAVIPLDKFGEALANAGGGRPTEPQRVDTTSLENKIDELIAVVGDSAGDVVLSVNEREIARASRAGTDKFSTGRVVK